MILKVFDVSHGSCNLLVSPTGKTELIDFGSDREWSPIQHVFRRYVPQGGRIDRLVLTHHHGDHMNEWEILKNKTKPVVVLRRRLKGSYLEACQESNSVEGQALAEDFDLFFADWNLTADPSKVSDDAWGMSISTWKLKAEQAATASDSANSMVNNCSYMRLYDYSGTKILLTGDMESEGMEAIIDLYPSFAERVQGLSVLVAPHHGHASAFCRRLFEIAGRPWIVLASMKRGDGSVDSRYSSRDFVKGLDFGGTIRRILTTRNDGAITIESKGGGMFRATINSR